MPAFFEKLIYASANEDSSSERKALALGAGDIVCCITASGARPLDLLLDNPARIVCVDFNPVQNALLRLKIAAMRQLSYEEYIGFLGLRKRLDRWILFAKIRPELSRADQDLWDAHSDWIRKGVFYQGYWERAQMRMASAMRFWRGAAVRRLMEARDLETQYALWQKEWNNWDVRLFMRILSSRFLWSWVAGEPGMKNISKDVDIGAYLWERLNHFFSHFMLRENALMQIVFLGGYTPAADWPAHLKPENYDLLRNRLDRLFCVDGTLQSALEASPNAFTAFSLSDFSSYASPQVYAQTWQAVQKAARPGARVCERYFLVEGEPQLHAPNLQRDPVLEAQLTSEDSTFFYRFGVGQFAQE